MTRIWLAALGVLALAGEAQAQETWSAITRTDNVVIGVERGSIRRTGDQVEVSSINAWLESPYGAYVVAKLRMDCAARAFVIGVRTTYDEEGEEIGTFTTEGPLTPIGPGSTQSIVAAAVCDDVWPSAFTAPTALEFHRRTLVELAP